MQRPVTVIAAHGLADELVHFYTLGCSYSGTAHWTGQGHRPPQRVGSGPPMDSFFIFSVVAAGGESHWPLQKKKKRKVLAPLARGSPLLGSSGTLFCLDGYPFSAAPPSLAHVPVPRTLAAKTGAVASRSSKNFPEPPWAIHPASTN